MRRSTSSTRASPAGYERVTSLFETTADYCPEAASRTVMLAASVLAIAGLVPLTAVRIALNAPLPLPGAVSGVWFDTATTLAVVGPASGAVLLGVTADAIWSRIGFVLVGVFGALSAVAQAAAVPAMGAIVVGGWLAVLGSDASDWSASSRRTLGGALATVLLASLTLSLLGATGVRPAVFRPVGTTLALAGMTATPLVVRPSTGSLAVGGVAAGVTLHLTATAPFVTGAVALVAGSVVGGSALLLATAVGGLTATLAHGLASRRLASAASVLLLTGGVPASIPRGIGVVLAVALLTRGRLR
jgi:hypothetical protein